MARRAALVEYVQANEHRFTRAALSAAAREAGYLPAEIDRAFERVAQRPPPSDMTIPVAILYVVLVVAIVAIGRGEAVTVGLLITLIGGIVGAVLLWNRNPGVARGLACGVVVVIAVPAVLLVGLYGYCLVTGFRFV